MELEKILLNNKGKISVLLGSPYALAILWGSPESVSALIEGISNSPVFLVYTGIFMVGPVAMSILIDLAKPVTTYIADSLQLRMFKKNAKTKDLKKEDIVVINTSKQRQQERIDKIKEYKGDYNES